VQAENALFYSSFIILCIFSIEILVSIVAFGIRYMCDIVRLLDMLIIFGSLFLEAYFKYSGIVVHGFNAIVMYVVRGTE
jgi:hypothetical protein